MPSAKITKDDTFSIVSDYIGKPIAAYNGVGNLVWDVEYDIFGNIRSQSKGDKDFIPFRNQGQYEDSELNGLMYNRFRYYDGNSGTYISQDPIDLGGNNSNFYAYVHNSNCWVDVFGLDELVYQLLNKKGEVIYYGITERSALTRGQEHINGTKTVAPKEFAKMQVLAENLSHDQARTMEARLIRERLDDRMGNYKANDSIADKLEKSGLLNHNRGRDIDIEYREFKGHIPTLDSPRDVDGLNFNCKGKN